MKKWQPVAYPGPGGIHRNANPALNQRGSWPDAGGYQQIIDELCALITGAGIALDQTKSNQVLTAVTALIASQTTSIPASAVLHYGTNSGSTANAVQLATSPVVPTLVAGTTIVFASPFDNTAAATLKADATDAAPLRRADGTTELSPGDVRAGELGIAVYDGSAWRYLSLQLGLPLVTVTDVGTANALSGTTSPRMAAWRAGQILAITKGAAANTSTTPAFTPSGLASRNLRRRDGSALAIGDLPANATFLAQYDGTVLRVLTMVPGEIADRLAAGGSLFNLKRFTTNARVSATGADALPTPVWSGIEFTKRSATSGLVVWASFQTQYVVASPATYYRLSNGTQSAQAVLNAPSTAHTIGQAGLLVLDGCPAGLNTFELSLLRPDATAWSTLFNPRSTDSANYAATTTSVLTIAEVEL